MTAKYKFHPPLATDKEITGIHTKRLLSLKDECYKANYDEKSNDDKKANHPLGFTFERIQDGVEPNPHFNPDRPVVSGNQKNRPVYKIVRITFDQIIAELKNRPHVPRKRESKETRKQKAKSRK